MVILLLIVVVVGIYFVSLKTSGQQAVAPTAPESEPLAAECLEECPNTDGTLLRNCTPPDQEGKSADSFCTYGGRVESCGGNIYCCSSNGGVWTTDMAACPTDL